jgi:anti-sigma factor ChrR (cupin superfamily)
MALPQDITPFDSTIADTVIKSADQKWIETDPGQAWMKVLWTGSESGRWAALFKWKKGYVAAQHKHLAAVQVFMLSGQIKVRGAILEAGDFVYEPNGVLHDATEALEDTEYILFGDGPVLFFNEDSFTGYMGWEELKRMEAGGEVPAASQVAAG